MKKNVVTTDPIIGVKLVSPDVIDSLEKNGTYLPDVERVVFNLHTTEKVKKTDADGNEVKEPSKNRDGSEIKDKNGNPVMKTVYVERNLENPVLVTRVWWADGTTTTVRNSWHDKVETETKKLDDGTEVVVADRCSKERGLMAAVVKRTCGVPDDNGEMTETNLGKIITDIVDSGYDQQLETAKAKVQRAKAKAKAADTAARNKEKKAKRYSYADCLQLVGPILESIAKNPQVVEKLASVIAGIGTQDANAKTEV